MKKENKKVKVAALASTAALIGVLGTNANATELINFEDLGTGSELRSTLLTADALTSFTSNTDAEFECGEGKCGEGKCGEGKCGEKSKKSDKKETKTVKADMKKADQPKEATKADKKAKKTNEAKSEEKSEKKETPKN